MSPAAALLRRLEAEAVAAPWEQDDPNDTLVANRGPNNEYQYIADASPSHGPGWTQKQERANARAICITRNLLLLLAGLVEAVGNYVEADGDRTHAALVDAYDALEAAAAKEVAHGQQG